jgi:segregation and condensation protein B
MNESQDTNAASSETGSGLPPLEDILLAALLAADRALKAEELTDIFDLGDGRMPPQAEDIETALAALDERLEGLPLELRKLASGYRIEVPQAYARWVSRLWVERPARYSRALLETLALIAYRQPITRPEIESVRGVAVSTHIVRTLTERGWVRVVGHRDVPGKPALYGTTKTFLDYFGLETLEELPTLAEIRDLSEFEPELPLGEAVSAEGEESPVGATVTTAEVVQGPWSGTDAADENDAAEESATSNVGNLADESDEAGEEEATDRDD